MGNRLRWNQMRDLALAVGLPVLAVAAAFWVAAQYIDPAPPRELTIAAASRGSPYWAAADRYRQILAESGITVHILETKGSMENLALLSDPAARVDAAFVQGGMAAGRDVSGLESLGRMFQEPVWIFYQGAQPPQRLTDLAGKRVMIGPVGSGTAALATRLLAASGVTSDTATLINAELPDAVDALEQGGADAGFFVLAPEARTIKRLFASPKVRLMNLVQADAYAQRYPFLKAVELNEGVVDFARDLPPVDTKVLATTAALVSHDTLHPALVSLLAQAALQVHRQPRLTNRGETGAFEMAGVFPIADDQEYPLAPEAQRVYKSGPPFFQRYLPFWLATLADRLMVMLLPILGILLPVVKFAPALYNWRIRRRVVSWYSELRRIEAEAESDDNPADIAAALKEIRRVERAINRIAVPLAFANQLYDLRGHLDEVRRRLIALRESDA